MPTPTTNMALSKAVDADNAKTYLETNLGSSLDTLDVHDHSGGTKGLAVLPSGVILNYGGGSAPAGWLLCDGSAVSRTTYSALFTAISTTFGTGDGSTTFNVPDMRGRAAAGVDGGVGRITTNNTLGAVGGTETHTLTTAQMPAHTHTTDSLGAHTHTIQSSSGIGAGNGTDIGGSSGAVAPYTTSSNGAHTHTAQSAGGGASHNNLQPYLVLNAIIKT